MANRFKEHHLWFVTISCWPSQMATGVFVSGICCVPSETPVCSHSYLSLRGRESSRRCPAGDLTQSCSDSTKTPKLLLNPSSVTKHSSPPPKIHCSPHLDGWLGQHSRRLSRDATDTCSEMGLAPSAGLNWQKWHFEGKKWHWTRRTLLKHGRNDWPFGDYMIKVILKQ